MRAWAGPAVIKNPLGRAWALPIIPVAGSGRAWACVMRSGLGLGQGVPGPGLAHCHH